LSKPKYLLDVNVLIALTDEGHVHHQIVMEWFKAPGLDWGRCAFSEAGYFRISVDPRLGRLTFEDATNILAALPNRSGYQYWPITADWAELVAPFRERVLGHQQVTDAWLLGLAIQEGGILVTLDKGIRSLAGAKYSKHVLVLEAKTMHG
jgi:toxin-antitoxin system PIN domain toxin